MIRVILVDDHPLFRAGAKASLAMEPDFEVVGEASTVGEALDLVAQLKPCVMLTDIRLEGDGTGVDLARRMRVEYPDVKVIVLTNYSNEPYIRAMMEVGVDGYILKDTPPRDVIECLRMAVEGRAVFSSQVSQTIIGGYVSGVEQLTKREMSVLTLLAEGATNAQIAESLNVSLNTVQFHLTNLYGKLGVKGRAEAIIQAARDGLVVIDA